jgi:hypothetical protein
MGIQASDGATKRQSLIAAKPQPLRDYGGPQRQNRCPIDVDGSTSVHWFQLDFKPQHLGDPEKVMEKI